MTLLPIHRIPTPLQAMAKAGRPIPMDGCIALVASSKGESIEMAAQPDLCQYNPVGIHKACPQRSNGLGNSALLVTFLHLVLPVTCLQMAQPSSGKLKRISPLAWILPRLLR